MQYIFIEKFIEIIKVLKIKKLKDR